VFPVVESAASNFDRKSRTRWQGFSSTLIFFVSASRLSLARSVLSHADGLDGSYRRQMHA
jgi:hypothetical protein